MADINACKYMRVGEKWIGVECVNKGSTLCLFRSYLYSMHFSVSSLDFQKYEGKQSHPSLDVH